MNVELSRDAVHLKMKSKWDAPLISELEFCYAAGLGLKKMGTEEAIVNELRGIKEFDEFRKRVMELVRTSEVWGTFEYGEKLKKLLLTCRINGSLNENTSTLFDMGYQG